MFTSKFNSKTSTTRLQHRMYYILSISNYRNVTHFYYFHVHFNLALFNLPLFFYIFVDGHLFYKLHVYFEIYACFEQVPSMSCSWKAVCLLYHRIRNHRVAWIR